MRGFANDKKRAATEIRERFDNVKFLSRENAPENELAFVTEKRQEKALKALLSEISGFAAANVIRVLE